MERHANAGTTPNRIAFTVVTPAGQAAAAIADEITAPGLLGEFGVLPGHVPFLAALKAGVLSWRDGAHGKQLLAVDKGYLQVGVGSRVIVMVEKAVKPEAIDLAEAREALAKHTESLKQGNMDPNELQLTRLALEWAQARVDAAERLAGGPAAAH